MLTSPSESQIKASHNILNNSVSKMMFSFGKSPRFPILKRSSLSYTFYNIPSTLSKRSTSLGYGKKTDFTLMNKGGGEYPQIKRDFDKGTKLGPTFVFGMSRSKVYCSTNNPLGRDSPGPGAYKPKRLINSPSYSLRCKVTIPLPNRDTPGPAAYTPRIGINENGNYPLSKMGNVHGSVFGSGKSNRFKYVYNDSPGPSAYTFKSMIGGSLFNSKFNNGRCITFGSKSNYGGKKDNFPGPGSYKAFSEFGLVDPYFKKKKFKKKKKSFKESKSVNLHNNKKDINSIINNGDNKPTEENINNNNIQEKI